VSADGRRPGQPDAVDPLALAEAVAAGRLGFAAAEAALWEAHPDDQGRAANEVAELRDLVTAIRGVRRHADAVRRADVDVFDPDATSVPLGVVPPTDDDRGIAPRRVHGGDVRLRPAARQRPSWAPVGALAAAAVLVVAVAIVVPGLLAPSVASTPVPSSGPTGIAVASPSASVAASPSVPPSSNVTSAPSVPPPAPSATGVKGVPAIPTEPLAGAPGIAYWTLTDEKTMTVTEWRPDGAAPRFRFTVPIAADPSTIKRETDRRVVVSPDGKRVVIAESTTTFARTRVFGTDGKLLWTDSQPTFTPDLAWSADGTRLLIGSQPDTFKLLAFSGSGAPSTTIHTFPGAAYRFLGFSDSGAMVYGWDTNGEADWWQTPFQVTVGKDTVTPIVRFSGKTEPIAVSNGTTPTIDIEPEDGTTTQVAGVDPKSYRVLDTGDLSGQGDTWEVRDGNGPNDGTKLKGLTTDISLAWGPEGSIVVADESQTKNPATITTVAVAASGTPLTPTFSVAAGTYWRIFEGSRGGFALLGLGAKRSGDAPWIGADQLVAVDLATARSAVLVPDDAGLTGLHTAGWITAP
jgi:hypothetical protein